MKVSSCLADTVCQRSGWRNVALLASFILFSMTVRDIMKIGRCSLFSFITRCKQGFVYFVPLLHLSWVKALRFRDRPAMGLISSYGDEDLHRRVGEIIKTRSVNKKDIRAVVKQAVDWSGIRSILDLGCGYGWLESSLDGGFDRIFGVDALEENGRPFLSAVQGKAIETGFERIILPAPLPFAVDSFDLIVAAYSLYFFAAILPEVRRVLKPEGTFLCITHSEGMLKEGEQFFHFRNLRSLIEGFSAENGEEKLKEHFGSVKYIDYVNSLVFNREDSRDLALYIAFKAEFISKDVDPSEVTERLLSELDRRGSLSFNKNDRIFLARK